MSFLATPLAISLLLAVAIGVLLYGFLVPRTQGSYSPAALTSENKVLRLTALLGNELYNALPEATDTRERKEHPRIESLLQRSGNPWGFTADEFLFFQVTTAFVGVILGAALTFLFSFLPSPFAWWPAIPLLGILGYLYPYLRYNDLANKRDLDFKRELPDALDLIMISLSAGVPLTQAMREALPNMSEGVLKEEFAEIVRQVDSGRPLTDALEYFAGRTPNAGIKAFVHAVREANRLNVSLGEVLEARAAESREDFAALVDSRIATLSSRLTIIMAPTLIPAVILTIIAPAIMSMIQNFN